MEYKYYELISGNQLYIFKGKMALDPKALVVELNTLDAEISNLKKENEELKKELEGIRETKLIENGEEKHGSK